MSTDREQGEQGNAVRAQHERLGGAIVVRASGDVDSAAAPVLGERLAAAFADAAAEGGVPVVVDLTAVPFFASAGMALLVEYHHVGRRQGTPLHVVAAAGSPLRALRAVTLDRLLRLHPSLSEALAAVSP